MDAEQLANEIVKLMQGRTAEDSLGTHCDVIALVRHLLEKAGKKPSYKEVEAMLARVQ